MTRVTKLLLILLLVIGGWYYNLSNLKDEQIAKNKAAAESQKWLQETKIKPYSTIDHAMARISKAYPRPVSEWLSQEKEDYQKLLTHGKFDLLIVPFQVNGYAVDRATRSFMAAQLAVEIAKTKNLKIPDPYLLARALGDGERRYDSNEVIRIAKRMGIKKIIWGYVGHNRSNTLSINIQSLDVDTVPKIHGQPTNGKTYNENLTFTDENPPIELYQTILPDILTALDINTNIRKPLIESPPLKFKLPSDPIELFSNMPEAVRDAYIFQILAYLTPERAERTRERFIEKSLIAVSSISPASPDYKAIKARAYMHLGLRPAAIEIIGIPNTLEEQALLAALNGNLPQVKEFAADIKSPVKQLLSMLDANTIAANYGVIEKNKSIDVAQSLELPSDIWTFLAIRAFTDWNNWSQFDNLTLKILLDHGFHIANFTAEGILSGLSNLGELSGDETTLNLTVQEHIKRLLKNNPQKWCCQSESLLTPMDYIDLIEATSTDNLMRRARFLTETQGRPKQAIKFLSSIEHVYKGHPEYTYTRGMANQAIANKINGVQKDALLKAAYIDAFNASFWARGQTRVAAEASSLTSKLRRYEYGLNGNFYAYDFPFRSYYPTSSNIPFIQAAIKNSTSNFWPVENLNWYLTKIKKDPQALTTMIDSIKGRFIGNPDFSLMLAEQYANNGNMESAEKHYREAIKANPEYSLTYETLGIKLFQNGRIEDAYNLFMSYPGFKDEYKGNRVALSNDSYGWGSLFFWSGHFDKAIPLYKIAADLDTGSGGSMASSLRLKLLDGDYEGAMEGSIRRAKRYNSSHAYRDYLGMLHVMGYSEEAWNAFNLLINRQPNPHIWQTALVGHRLGSSNELDITKWVEQYHHLVSEYGNSYAAKYLLRAGVTDRMPTENLAKKIQEIDRPVWKVADQWNHVVRNSGDGKLQYTYGPNSVSSGSVLHLGVFARSDKSQVKSDLAYFAESYRAIRIENFVKAQKLLDEASQLYDMRNINLSYVLPYYAFSAAKSGDRSGIEQILGKFGHDQQGFDFYLAKAILAGLKNNTDESIQYLTKALYNRPYTENRPLYTEYEYAEICELLYLETGNIEYKRLMLDWSKKVQRFSPWFAWPYAIEAKYSTNVEEKQKAIAMTHYLDQNSERLNSVSKEEISAAVKKYEGLNPFLNKIDLESI